MVYMGSKTKYAKYIVPILQQAIDSQKKIWGHTTFIDACCGGCNIIQNIECDKRVALDINPYLIDLYKYAVEEKGEFPDKITREEWDSCKNHPEDNPSWKVALVAYFCSYSARGFGGGYACNGDRDYYNERLRNFKRQLPLLEGIEFKCGNVNDLVANNCVIYIDPPYMNTKKYDYGKGFNYDEFWETVRRLSINNIVYVSEQTAPDDFKAEWSLDVKRNCFGATGNAATENLFIWVGNL